MIILADMKEKNIPFEGNWKKNEKEFGGEKNRKKWKHLKTSKMNKNTSSISFHKP